MTANTGRGHRTGGPLKPLVPRAAPQAPRRLAIAGQSFRVDVVDREHPDLTTATDMRNVGSMRLLEQRLVVARGLAPDQVRDTVLHEVLHAFLGVIQVEMTRQAEERAVRVIAPLLLEFLRRNRATVAWLQSEGAP